MFKALLKKQLLELNQFYFSNNKTGKARSRKGAIGMMILFGAIFLVLAVAVFMMAMAIFTPFHAAGLDWLYFAIFTLIALMLGVFGSVFNTYSSMYLAKDNDLLLSMPIPPRMILLVRMIGVGLMSCLYTAIVWIPATIRFWIQDEITFLKIIAPIGGFIVLTAIVTVLTCILGWVVAKAAVKLKNKSFITVLISIVFIAIYYVIYFKMSQIIRSIVTNMEQLVTVFKGWGYPIYICGRAATGEILPMIIVTVIGAALFALTYFIISRSFIKIVTTSTATARKEYKEKTSTKRSISRALFGKELSRFTSSSVYMLNAGLGIIIIVGVTIFIAIKSGEYLPIIQDAIALMNFGGVLIPLATVVICLCLGMDCISAPSISIEGNALWIVRSLPVKTWDILKAKERLHIVINGIPAIVCGIALGCIAGGNVLEVALIVIVSVLFIWAVADFGLMMNLLKPNLTWKNEAMAVKQSMAVLFTILFAWGLACVFGGSWFIAKFVVATPVFMIIWAVIFAGIIVLLRLWLKKKGTRIFEDLL